MSPVTGLSPAGAADWKVWDLRCGPEPQEAELCWRKHVTGCVCVCGGGEVGFVFIALPHSVTPTSCTECVHSGSQLAGQSLAPAANLSLPWWTVPLLRRPTVSQREPLSSPSCFCQGENAERTPQATTPGEGAFRSCPSPSGQTRAPEGRFPQVRLKCHFPGGSSDPQPEETLLALPPRPLAGLITQQL